MCEQNYAKQCTVAGIMNNKATIMTHKMTTRQMFGLKYASQIESGQFDNGQGSGNQCDDKWFFYVAVFPSLASNTPVGLVANLEYDIEFFNRSPDNPFSA